MRTPTKTPPAAKGGALEQQLDKLISAMPAPVEATPKWRLTHRQKTAIESVRRYICGEIGVKATDVTDRHVARLALKIDGNWAYRNNFYIGDYTLESVKVWAADLLAGREVAR